MLKGFLKSNSFVDILAFVEPLSYLSPLCPFVTLFVVIYCFDTIGSYFFKVFF